ncbi:hypothetical protein BMB171_C5039 [Bacillus thuringiensis BMB171]|nr:hypothetical protein BMB171_C5039 [Bacillus thuringiensis BMB171]
MFNWHFFYFFSRNFFICRRLPVYREHKWQYIEIRTFSLPTKPLTKVRKCSGMRITNHSRFCFISCISNQLVIINSYIIFFTLILLKNRNGWFNFPVVRCIFNMMN